MRSASCIEDMPRKFRMEDAKPCHTPMVAGLRLQHKVPDDLVIDTGGCPCAQLVGSLLFASNLCRMDITHATNTLARAMARPSLLHWKAAKRALACLGTCKDLCLSFRSNVGAASPCEVLTMCDADFAGDSSRHSTQWCMSTLDGSTINWQSELDESKVALSTMESELKSTVEACKDNMHHVHLLRDMKVKCNVRCKVANDNMPAIELCCNPEHHGRAKHIDVAQHFVRHLHSEGKIDLVHVGSEDNLADMLTKPLGRTVFERLRDRVMVPGLRGGIEMRSQVEWQ